MKNDKVLHVPIHLYGGSRARSVQPHKRHARHTAQPRCSLDLHCTVTCVQVRMIHWKTRRNYGRRLRGATLALRYRQQTLSSSEGAKLKTVTSDPRPFYECFSVDSVVVQE